MILKKVITISDEVSDYDDPVVEIALQTLGLSERDSFLIVHGGISEVFKIIDRPHETVAEEE